MVFESANAGFQQDINHCSEYGSPPRGSALFRRLRFNPYLWLSAVVGSRENENRYTSYFLCRVFRLSLRVWAVLLSSAVKLPQVSRVCPGVSSLGSPPRADPAHAAGIHIPSGLETLEGPQGKAGGCDWCPLLNLLQTDDQQKSWRKCTSPY